MNQITILINEYVNKVEPGVPIFTSDIQSKIENVSAVTINGHISR